MSTPSQHRSPNHPAWLNIAAVVGLLTFLTCGFLALRHLSGDHKKRNSTTGDSIPRQSESRFEEEPTLKLVRPGEQPGRIIFADPQQAATAEDFRILAENNPKAAASLVAKMPDSPTRDERMYDLMQIWVGKDPSQAADWVVGLPYSDMKDHATAELGLAWGKVNPVAASSWVGENIFTENAPAGASSLVSSWSRNDIEAASEWVDSLDVDAPARADALKALAYHLGELDPQRGLTWFSRLVDEDRNLIAVNFAASWASTDPRGAANWLRFQAKGIEPRIRDQATLAVIHSWAVDSEAAASTGKWIDKLEDSALKENAKATFAESHAETSPQEALPWATDLKDPERRREVTMVVLEEWVIQDKESFKVSITDGWEKYDEPLRHEIYDLLLDHDPEFKDELFKMFEKDRVEENAS